jgi:hypothetical protein
VGVQAMKASESPMTYFASKKTVKRKDILSISNTVSQNLIKNCRQAISGLQIVDSIPTGPHR